MFRNRANRAKHVGGEFTPALDKRLHELPPRIAVRTERSLGIAQVPFQYDCGSIIERMGERSRRMNPLQSMIFERQRREERRPGAHRMHRRSKVVQEAWQSQFHRARCTARCRLSLEHIDLQAGLGQDDGRCKPIWARANAACFAAHRESPTDLMLLALLLNFECATISYCFGSTLGHSTTLTLPSGARSSVGAYRPKNCLRHHSPLARFSDIAVNQYCQSTARI